MDTQLATFRNGQVEFDETTNWPDGTRLVVTTDDMRSSEMKPVDWPSTAADRLEWAAWLRELEPFDMTEAERKAFEDFLKANKEQQKSASVLTPPTKVAC